MMTFSPRWMDARSPRSSRLLADLTATLSPRRPPRTRSGPTLKRRIGLGHHGNGFSRDRGDLESGLARRSCARPQGAERVIVPSGPPNGKGTTGCQNEPRSQGVAHLVFQLAQWRRGNEVVADVDQDRP
jgi:hypothetical protein